MNREVIVYLVGGLGNQMFQYAMGRSLSLRHSADLYLDRSSGFLLDFRYKRAYELSSLPIQARSAGFSRQLPFWCDRLLNKGRGRRVTHGSRHPWGRFISENPSFSSIIEMADCQADGRRLWLRGFWQSENYFSDHKADLARELSPPRPTESIFSRTADLIEKCNSVAVGVRLFEEMPGKSQAVVGGITPKSFYGKAALELAKSQINPVFFVFCTHDSPFIHELDLPGQVFYITPENGFAGALPNLWLMSRCRHHVISNSSFYWWGAWLAEWGNSATRVYASDNFPNKDTIPARWTAFHHDRQR
jgi:hypothetical protein